MKYSPHVVSGAVIATLVFAAGYAVWFHHWSNLFVIVQAVILCVIPYILEYRYDICISEKLRVGIVLFIFSTLFLGEINSFYDQYVWWDAALHFVAGLGLTLIGFILLVTIYSRKDLRSTPFLTSLFAFSFSGMVAALWEVYEFLIDSLSLARNPMQPSPEDTMIDILVAFGAGLIVCILGYRYLKLNEKNQAAKIIEESLE